MYFNVIVKIYFTSGTLGSIKSALIDPECLFHLSCSGFFDLCLGSDISTRLVGNAQGYCEFAVIVLFMAKICF